MSSTTLFTFFLIVPSCYSVQLFGSWDNFTNPYPMRKDTQKGHGHWVGCHSFDHIIHDGNPSGVPKTRKGGLRMGETYYYFYKLDNGIDHYNRTEPITLTCPLAPGQPVNILEVPIELPASPEIGGHSHRSTYGNLTLNPKDRYKKLRDTSTRKPLNPSAPPSRSTGQLPQSTKEDVRKRSWGKTQLSASEQSLIQDVARPKRASLSKATQILRGGDSNKKQPSKTEAKRSLVPKLARPATPPESRLSDRPRTRKGDPPSSQGRHSHGSGNNIKRESNHKVEPSKHVVLRRQQRPTSRDQTIQTARKPATTNLLRTDTASKRNRSLSQSIATSQPKPLLDPKNTITKPTATTTPPSPSSSQQPPHLLRREIRKLLDDDASDIFGDEIVLMADGHQKQWGGEGGCWEGLGAGVVEPGLYSYNFGGWVDHDAGYGYTQYYDSQMGGHHAWERDEREQGLIGLGITAESVMGQGQGHGRDLLGEMAWLGSVIV